MNTLLLDRTVWDLLVDSQGDIAVAEEPYALAQDVSSAVRTFRGECLYDSTRGLPYLQTILGRAPPRSFLDAKIEAAAKTVPGVASAVSSLGRIDTSRNLTGTVTVQTTTGTQLRVSL